MPIYPSKALENEDTAKYICIFAAGHLSTR
jgi:hypothetical protein